jgi:hypothetical protein
VGGWAFGNSLGNPQLPELPLLRAIGALEIVIMHISHICMSHITGIDGLNAKVYIKYFRGLRAPSILALLNGCLMPMAAAQ